MISPADTTDPIVTKGILVASIAIFAVMFLFLYIRILRRRDRKKSENLEQTQEVEVEHFERTRDLDAPILLGDILKNTRAGFIGRIQSLFSEGNISGEKLSDLEEILFTSDLGPQTVETLMTAVTDKADGNLNFENVKSALRDEMRDIFSRTKETSLVAADTFSKPVPIKPWVWMVVGVNGVGKTTTIGKLAKQFSSNGKKVLVAAGDTFRAAAQEQLTVWSGRTGVDIHSPKDVSDPAAVAFSACEKAKNQHFDILIIDTAGRLHTKSNLMEELKKMKRVVEKALPGAPHEVLLVVDANTGQNALNQARTFHEALGVTGVVLTKLDGTAKGGVAVGIACELKIPIVWIGVGEKAQDLKSFAPTEFVSSIL
ncbi:MAG: hypothetical protein A4S09_02980 [Proteobacteria bacterium SG_bin7]|nr:MAG: hypothetical protein A4S09_02980 [Proteobacteria bacterium SG_bin7]